MPNNLIAAPVLNFSTNIPNGVHTTAYFTSTASVGDWIGGGAGLGAMIGSALGFGLGMYRLTHKEGRGGGSLLARYDEFIYLLKDLFVTTPLATRTQ